MVTDVLAGPTVGPLPHRVDAAQAYRAGSGTTKITVDAGPFGKIDNVPVE